MLIQIQYSFAYPPSRVWRLWMSWRLTCYSQSATRCVDYTITVFFYNYYQKRKRERGRQELWISKISLLRTNCTTSLNTKCPPRALHRNSSNSLPNKIAASGSRSKGLVNKMYWTSAYWSLVFDLRRRKGWRISFRAACKTLHKIWRAENVKFRLSTNYAFPFLILGNNLHSNWIVSLTLWKVKRWCLRSRSAVHHAGACLQFLNNEETRSISLLPWMGC